VRDVADRLRGQQESPGRMRSGHTVGQQTRRAVRKPAASTTTRRLSPTKKAKRATGEGRPERVVLCLVHAATDSWRTVCIGVYRGLPAGRARHT
jgi:hypothetical protein